MSTKRIAAPTRAADNKRKRRRRNIRTADVSSDSSSSESESENEVEMKDVEAVVEDDEEVVVDDDEEEEEEEEEEERVEKSNRIPSPLRDLHDPQAAARFEEYYMRLITGEFGDDLNNVRMAKDFSEKSLPLLVRALKQGVNIFSADEKRVVVA